MSDISKQPIYRVRRTRGLEPLTLRLLLIAGGLTGALVLIIVAWSAVGHRGAGGPVPVVQADSRPVRVKPANPGGMQIPGLSTDTGSGNMSASADKLAPAPETPDPQALASQTRAASARPAAPSAGPARPVPVASAAAAPPTAVPARPSTVASAGVAAEHRVAPLAPAHGPVGRTEVQLAAVGSESAARQEWERLAHRMPGVLAAHHPVFIKVERDGHSLWRLRTGDFTTEAEASQFCQQVRAGGGGCAIAAF